MLPQQVPPPITAFELKFQPSVVLIHVVRRFVTEFYNQVLDDPDAVSRLALATHELLENAVKYSLDGTTSLSITVDQEQTTPSVSIRLRNRANRENIDALCAIFDEMQQYPDSFMHYQTVLARSVKNKHGSGLGIPRVRAEGEMRMSHTIDDDCVCIVAETQIESGRQA